MLIRDLLPADRRARVLVTPPTLDPRQTKWLISQVNFFCGTRMHSTIAALSSSVPAAAIAYSRKTRGVFDTCGLADNVFDPRQSSTDDIAEQLWASWLNRDQTKDTLKRSMPHVMAQVNDQMDAILYHSVSERTADLSSRAAA